MRKSGGRTGFTLIEMLSVMAIIGLLAGILLTAVQSARQQAKKVKARHDVEQIATAWLAYLQEYRRFPSVSIQSMGSNAVGILSGRSNPNNARGVVFLELGANATNYPDPWGKEYAVVLDSDYDNMVTNLPGVVGLANVSVAVWSAGRDGLSGTPDDVRSWQK